MEFNEGTFVVDGIAFGSIEEARAAGCVDSPQETPPVIPCYPFTDDEKDSLQALAANEIGASIFAEGQPVGADEPYMLVEPDEETAPSLNAAWELVQAHYQYGCRLAEMGAPQVELDEVKAEVDRLYQGYLGLLFGIQDAPGIINETEGRDD